jgi:Ca2+-binding EF-hand superfamily protein
MANAVELKILKDTFDKFDSDSDGHLQMPEVKALFGSMKWDVSEENMKRAMEFLDKDHNGTLEFEEFLKFKEYAFQSHVLHEPALTPKHRAKGGALGRLREESAGKK